MPPPTELFYIHYTAPGPTRSSAPVHLVCGPYTLDELFLQKANLERSRSITHIFIGPSPRRDDL